MSVLTRERERSGVVPITRGAVILTVLGALVVIGVFAGIGRLFMGLGASTALSDSYSWGIWIGFDFLLIAFSGAGFTMAGLAHVLRRHKYHDAMRPAVLAGLAGYSAVLMILLLDLGRFDRFYNFLRFWNMHSPLFEICWCVLLYTTVLAIEVSPLVFERFGWSKPLNLVNRLMLPVAITGVTLSSLHQSTLGTLYLNMPHRLHELWYTPLLPVLFFTSSVMAGLALTIIAYTAAARIRGNEVRPAIVSGLGRIVGWIAVLYLLLKVGDFVAAGELPALLAFDRMSLLMWIELGLGVLLPALLLLVPALRASWSTYVGAGLILFGVLANRFNATLFGQVLPAGATSYTPHIIEWATTIGIISAALLAWYVGVRLLGIFESKSH
jgi:Ni/Fe-hydrogenase subunit HybB-like protein